MGREGRREEKRSNRLKRVQYSTVQVGQSSVGRTRDTRFEPDNVMAREESALRPYHIC